MKKQKKLLSALLSLIMILTLLPISALDGFAVETEDGLVYTVTASGRDVIVSGYVGEEPFVTVPATVGDYNVVGIGTGAFKDNSVITNVEISSGITEIGSAAFSNCPNLFDVIIPSTVTRITENIFEECPNLIYAIIHYSPDGRYTGLHYVPILFDMGDAALGKNTSLLYNVQGYTNSSVYKCDSGFLFSRDGKTLVKAPSGSIPVNYRLPNVEKIGDDAFDGCMYLEWLTIPSTVNTFGDTLFTNCRALRNITLEVNPDIAEEDISETYAQLSGRVTQIYLGDKVVFYPGAYDVFGDNVKYYDVSDTHPLYDSLDDGVLYSKTMSELIAYPYQKEGKKFTVWGNVKKICDWAFCSAQYLEEVKFTANTEEIGIYAFADCENLKKVTLPTSMGIICDAAFINCHNLTDINIPNGVIAIGEKCFENCRSLKSVVLPKTMAQISDELFCGCTSLESVVIPDGVTAIGSNAFFDCDALKEITIPYSVQEIGDFAIDKACTKLIYGYEGSAAETYARENGIEFASLGVTDCQHSRTIQVDKPATCTEDGYIKTVCAVCGKELSTKVIYSYGHVWGEPTYTWSKDYATATASRVCLNDESHIETETVTTTSVVKVQAIPQLGQNGITQYTAQFDNPAFSGQIIEVVTDVSIYTSEDGLWKYQKLPDDTIRIFNSRLNKAYLGTQTRVTVPAKIDGLTVSSIGDSAFANCDFIKSVVLPQGIDTVDSYAFYYCTSLESIKIPDGVTAIGSLAFFRCTSLESVDIPSSVTLIGGWAFQECRALESIELPAGLTQINMGVFENCVSLKSIVIPDSVTSVKDYAFRGCSSLAEVDLGSGVERIEDYAFYQCLSLTEVTLPESLVFAGERSFAECAKLESVRIPASVKGLGDYTFSGCKKLCDIYYESGRGEWNALSNTSPTSYLENVRIHYNVTGEHEYTVIRYTPPTCTEDGVLYYSCPCGYEKIETVPSPGHKWGDIIYVWAEDYSSVTATRTCQTDETHIESETVYTTVTEIAATCDRDGRFVYTANFENPAFATQQKAVDSGKPAGHNWGNVSYTWSSDNSTVTAIRICTFDSSHIESETADVRVETLKAPTDTQSGLLMYTAEFENPDFGTVSRVVTVPPVQGDYKGFPDVGKNDWFYDAVRYVSERGFITGYKNGKFGPADALQRQDFIVILARISGADLSQYNAADITLTDVNPNAYYASAVAWAVESGIIKGYDNGKFGVGDKITREQVCTILYRYMKEPSVTSPDEALSAFGDAGKVSSFAKTAVAWAVANGVISGKNASTLAPSATASRAEIATIIMRMDQRDMF